MLPEEFVKDLKETLKLFKGANEEIASLKQTVATLEARLAAQYVQTGEKPRHLGEWDSESQAKGFVDFIRDLKMQDPAVLRQNYVEESTDQWGGYLVPDDFNPTLLRLIENFGVIRNEATVIPMQRMELKFPKLVNGVQVFWVDEHTTIPETRPQFDLITLTNKKLAALIPASSEILEDSTIAMANLLSTLIAEAIAKEEDRVGFTGDTTAATPDPFDGILYDPTVTVMPIAGAAITSMDADDLMDLIAQVPTPALGGARFYMHRTVFDVVRKLKDGQGNYIYQAPAQGQPGTIWGYPYTLVESLLPVNFDNDPGTGGVQQNDEPFVIFGNLKYMYMTDRRRLTAAVSTHYGFATDSVWYRWTERIGFKVVMGNALAVLKTAP